MAGKLCLLGFGANVASLIFSTLEALGHGGELVLIENVVCQDAAPFDCGMRYIRFMHAEYRYEAGDRYLFGVMEPRVKKLLFTFFEENAGIVRQDYTNVLHPSLILSSTSRLDLGIYMEPGVIISPFAELGFGCSVNRASSVGHHTRVGEFASIGPGVTIAGHCHIRAGANISIGVTVFDRITIGEGSIIGGGSVVTKDVPPGVLAYGNPCKVIKSLE